MWIAPFSVDNIHEYIKNFVNRSQERDQKTEWDMNTKWDAKTYQNALVNLPHLQTIVSNPFLLKIVLRIFPELLERSEQAGQSQDWTYMNDL